MVSASTLSPELGESLEKRATGNVKAAGQVGSLLAQKAMKLKVTTVVFDRNRYRYHGRVRALAESAREGGLEF